MYNIDSAIKKCFNYQLKTQKYSGFWGYYNFYIPDYYIFSKPHTLTVKLTKQCNLRCKHCFFSSTPEQYEMKNQKETLFNQKIIEIVDSLGIIKVILTGGEPFCYNSLFSLIKSLKERNIMIDIQTNSLLINCAEAKKLSLLLNKNCDAVQVSIDGCTKSVHDGIRGQGAFLKLIEKLKLLNSFGINVSLNYTITSRNINELPMLYNIMKKYHIKTATISRFKCSTEEQYYLIPDNDEIFYNLAELINKVRFFDKIRFNIAAIKAIDYINMPKGKKLFNSLLDQHTNCDNLSCHKNERITLLDDGNLVLCLACDIKEGQLGNIFKNNILTIWNNRQNNIFFKKRVKDKSTCKNCKYVNMCKSGCPIEAYKLFGSIYKQSPQCLNYEKLAIKNEN